MMRLTLLCLLAFPAQLFAQRADSTLSNIYVQLVREIANNYPAATENLFVINDLYYPEYQETPIGYDPDADTLVYSHKFREMTYYKLAEMSCVTGLMFGVPSQYNAVFGEFNYEFTGPHKGKQLQFFYIDKPVNNRDYYDLSFNEPKEFVIHIPVQVFESNGTTYQSHVAIYRLSSDAKGKLTIKKL